MNKYREGKVKSTPERGVKELLKPCVYKQGKLDAKAERLCTFCIMNRRLNACGELKPERRRRSESESEVGESRAHYNPKPGDLLMARLKRG